MDLTFFAITFIAFSRRFREARDIWRKKGTLSLTRLD